LSRLIIFGATGSLGSHVLRLALAARHQVTVFVRTPSRLPLDAQTQVLVHQGDLSTLAPVDIAQLISGHDALINCAGLVTEGQTFVDLIDRLVTAVESLPTAAQPVCWFLAGAALLDIGPSGRKGVELPRVKSTYWPHRVNFERISRSGLEDWRLLCPGPMVEEPALGLNRLRIALDTLPVQVPGFARALPGPLLLPIFVSLIPQMIVPYADAATLILANLNRGDAMTRHRVGLALPLGMRGKKSQWAARPRNAS
jgi:putative NADH-flavin reductase